MTTLSDATRHLMAEVQVNPMQFDAGGEPCADDGSAAIVALCHPPSYCPVCWYHQFPDVPFPSSFSSATCPGHAPKA